jgi:hypothetical protein
MEYGVQTRLVALYRPFTDIQHFTYLNSGKAIAEQ